MQERIELISKIDIFDKKYIYILVNMDRRRNSGKGFCDISHSHILLQTSPPSEAYPE